MNLAAANELPTITTTASNTSYYTPVGGNLVADASNYLNLTTTTIQPFAVPPQQQTQKETMPTSNKRVVQIFIADPNESIPLDHALVYQDKAPHFTDLTDQELFFEIDLKGLLDSHNEYRKNVVDKEASEGKSKDVMLEAAKIRDLKMVVVEVAKF